MKKQLFFMAGMFLLNFSILAQESTFHESPSLQMGLNGLTFKPGNLDAELIAQIIAEKQEEVKTKVIKNWMLKQVNDAGGTIYTYTDNILNSILYEKSTEIRTKNILENTVNLTFSMAFAKFYFEKSKNDEKWKNLSAKLIVLAKEREDSKASKFYDCLTGEKKQNKSFISIDDNSHVQSAPFIYLLDIVSEAIKQNPKLQRLGLMRPIYSGENNSLNLYINDTLKKVNGAEEIYNDVSNILQNSLDNIGFLSKYLSTQSLTQKDSEEVLIQETITMNQGDFLSKVKANITIIEKIITDSGSEYKTFQNLHFSDLNEYLLYLRRLEDLGNGKISLSSASDIVYHINKEIKPRFEGLKAFVPEIKDLYVATNQLEKFILSSATSKSDKAKFTEYLRLVAKLYEFRKAKTYSDYLNIVNDLPNLIPSEQIGSTLKTLLSFVKNYTIIKSETNGNEVIEVDLESLLARLQFYSNNRLRPVRFVFSVGANTGYTNKQSIMVNGEYISNLSYVGEKIGVKFMLKDWQYLRSFNKNQTFYRTGRKYIRLQPPQEPTVSNLHLLFYGTGILYNLTNSSNNKNFTLPMVGTGLGLTFFNSLDMNLSFNFPQKKEKSFKENFSFKTSIISLGFDIPINEYLSKLQTSRKQNQSNKKMNKLIN